MAYWYIGSAFFQIPQSYLNDVHLVPSVVLKDTMFASILGQKVFSIITKVKDSKKLLSAINVFNCVNLLQLYISQCRKLTIILQYKQMCSHVILSMVT